MLAEQLAVTFNAEMSDVRQRLEHGGDSALAEWLRSRKRDDTAFLLAIDQFEELFTFADAAERKRFDNLLAAALADADCPLYLISTVRVDFLDRFETHLPQLNLQRARIAHTWPLPQLDDDGLREVIDGPARLANLDVSEVMEMMVEQARGEPGALPLIENALDWLWDKGEKDLRSGRLRLSGRLFNDKGGLAGILSQAADDLLASLGKEQERALQLLFQLVKIDTEGLRHARRPIPLAEAVAIAGGGERGRKLVDHLAGRRSLDGAKNRGPLRLITVTDDPGMGKSNQHKMQWVNLIHETLIRNKGNDKQGKPQPYWPTLWHYIEAHKEQAAQRELLEWLARQWKPHKGMKRLRGLASGWDLLHFWKLSTPGSLERAYLRWSAVVASTIALILTLVIGTVGESAWWAQQHNFPPAYILHKPLWMLGYMLEPELVEIPPGKFTMGCVIGRDDGDGVCPDDEIPTREVTTRPFSLGKYEVTFLEYDAFVWHMKREGRRGSEWDYPPDESWGRSHRPVINVSWQDAKAYVQWLSDQTGKACRLPTEAEWEYAARGGTGEKYGVPVPDGSDGIAGKGLANCDGCGSEWDERKTAPVGSFPANRLGLHDLSGNVWEWVEDTYQRRYPEGPTGAEALVSEEGWACVVRGGSWGNDPDGARSSARDFNRPDVRDINIGFRVLCESPIE
jgi:formylglycine-generating enzyme required for sulfatase activity